MNKLEKLLKVINSCETLEQLDVAMEYMSLAKLSGTDSIWLNGKAYDSWGHAIDAVRIREGKLIRRSRVAAIKEVYRTIEEYFNYPKQAHDWFYYYPREILGGVTPEQATLEGRGQDVLDLIERIRHGVFS